MSDDALCCYAYGIFREFLKVLGLRTVVSMIKKAILLNRMAEVTIQVYNCKYLLDCGYETRLLDQPVLSADEM